MVELLAAMMADQKAALKGSLRVGPMVDDSDALLDHLWAADLAALTVKTMVAHLVGMSAEH